RSTPIVFVASRRFRGAAHRSEAMRRYAPASYLVAPQELGELQRRLDAVASAGGAGAATPPPELAAADAGDDAGADGGGHGGAGAASADGEARAAGSGPAPIPPEDPAQRREKRDVERTARSLSQSDADLRGTLRRTPFAR